MLKPLSVLCDPGVARTLDPLIKSQLLYQLSYGVWYKKERKYTCFCLTTKINQFSGSTPPCLLPAAFCLSSRCLRP